MVFRASRPQTSEKVEKGACVWKKIPSNESKSGHPERGIAVRPQTITGEDGVTDVSGLEDVGAD